MLQGGHLHSISWLKNAKRYTYNLYTSQLETLHRNDNNVQPPGMQQGIGSVKKTEVFPWNCLNLQIIINFSIYFIGYEIGVYFVIHFQLFIMQYEHHAQLPPCISCY